MLVKSINNETLRKVAYWKELTASHIYANMALKYLTNEILS